MTVEEAAEKARDVLPLKILQQHVHKEAMTEIFALLTAHIFGKANGLPFEELT